MSFSTDIKQEISNVTLKKHCQKAELSALIQLTSSLTISSSGLGILVTSESATAARRILFLLKELYAVETKLQFSKKTKLKKNNVYTITVNNGASILEDLGLYSDKGLLDHPRYEIVSKNCCAAAYLSGCFLAYGSCNHPSNANYHLEISLNTIEHANFVVKLISRFDIKAKIVKRRSRYVVYLKKADYISDFLTIINAFDARMSLEDERIARDLKNSVSRISNCEIANEVKTFKAAQKQVEYIEKIIANDSFDLLDEKLKNVAHIRLKYQDYSLLELCDAYQKNFGELISKSGMKHRLNKLESIALALEG